MAESLTAEQRAFVEFEKGLEAFLISAFAGKYTVRKESRTAFDPAEDARKRFPCDCSIEAPRFVLYTGMNEAAFVDYGFEGSVRVKSVLEQFDQEATIFFSRYGNACTFANHNIETLIQLPGVIKPPVFADTRNGFAAIGSLFVEPPATLHLFMKDYGYYAMAKKYLHGGVVVQIRRAKNARPGAGVSLEVELPVHIKKIEEAFRWIPALGLKPGTNYGDLLRL